MAPAAIRAAGAREAPVVTVRVTTLDEGLTVVTERMPDVRSVSIGFWAAVADAAVVIEQAWRGGTAA